SCGGAELLWIGGERLVRLGDAYRQVAMPLALPSIESLTGLGSEVDTIGTIEASRDTPDLVGQRQLGRVEEVKVAFALGGFRYRFGQGQGSLSAITYMSGDLCTYAYRGGQFTDCCVLAGVIAGKGVDGHHWSEAVGAYIIDLLEQVGAAFEHFIR